jgi:hypothetical protein
VVRARRLSIVENKGGRPMFDPHQISLRHRCRNPGCRSKLPAPVADAHQAFCCQSCCASFYRTRCAVCERDISADPMTGERRSGSAHRRYCGRKCKTAARSLARFLSLPGRSTGAFPATSKSSMKSRAEMPHKPGRAPCGKGIAGPSEVIAAEVWADRQWHTVVSPDGVETEVGILRAANGESAS